MTGASVETTYFIGTSGWIYDHWKGRFYPEGLAKSHWFDYYAGRFNSVEINATFYGTFKDQTYLNWKVRAPEGFGYVLKAPQTITHRKFLWDVDEEIKAFWRSCTLLEEHFEMVLLQVAPQTPYDLVRLKKALLAFPNPHKVAVEFRDPCWQTSETQQLLNELGATCCSVDSPRQKLTKGLISDCAYLRLHGRQHWYSYNYSAAELNEIAVLARDLAHQGARRVYIFFNNDFGGYAPANAQALAQLLLPTNP